MIIVGTLQHLILDTRILLTPSAKCNLPANTAGQYACKYHYLPC